MKTIYKYTLNPSGISIVELPVSTQILSAECQRDQIVVYGLTNPQEEQMVNYEFRAFGTGHEFDIDESFKFLDTVKMFGGDLMFHVFYKKKV